jgi:hypothetical protein
MFWWAGTVRFFVSLPPYPPCDTLYGASNWLLPLRAFILFSVSFTGIEGSVGGCVGEGSGYFWVFFRGVFFLGERDGGIKKIKRRT